MEQALGALGAAGFGAVADCPPDIAEALSRS